MATCPTCRKHYPDDVATCADDGAELLPDAAFGAAETELKAGDTVGEFRIEAKLGALETTYVTSLRARYRRALASPRTLARG